MFRLIAVMILLANLVVSECQAKDLAGIDFPETAMVGGKSLLLNGLGVRKATVFKVKVYAAGLYLENKSGDAGAILNTSETKQIRMVFLRDVGADKLRSAWKEGVTNNNTDWPALSARIEKLNSYMADVVEKDQITLTFASDGLLCEINGRSFPKIEGGDFSRALLAVWIGQNPPNEDLKLGLLGAGD